MKKTIVTKTINRAISIEIIHDLYQSVDEKNFIFEQRDIYNCKIKIRRRIFEFFIFI